MDNLPYPARQNQPLPTPADPGPAGVQLALDALLQQSRGLTPADIATFMDHLELLMKDCSQANIQVGKNWVVQHCQTPQQYDLISRAMVAIAISRKSFNDKLHIVYLTNDILSHSERKQQRWIKEAFYPHLVPILRIAYYFPGIDDSQRQRVIKVLDIWRNKEFFPANIVDTMEANVRRPPLLPPPLPAGGLIHPIPAHIPGAAPHQQVPHQNQYPPQHPPQHLPQHLQHPPQAQQHVNPHPGSWPPPNPHIPGPHHPYPAYPPTQQQQFGQPVAPLPFQHPPHIMQPGFQQQPPQQQQQQPQQQQQQPHMQGVYHPPYQTQAAHPVVTPAPAPPPPAPTHRDTLTRDLPARLMMSKIESNADYYEPLPAYVSIPIQKTDALKPSVLESVNEFILENSTIQPEGNNNGIKNEGWHEGYLDEFYKTASEKRKIAFSKDPKPSRHRRHGQRDEHGERKEDRSRDQGQGRGQGQGLDLDLGLGPGPYLDLGLGLGLVLGDGLGHLLVRGLDPDPEPGLEHVQGVDHHHIAAGTEAKVEAGVGVEVTVVVEVEAEVEVGVGVGAEALVEDELGLQ
ncbi:hypothetical protein BGX21_010908 [Mortierella sp. AD011]|nr:hypothetical protein BGX20_001456 [Mortierella sp. AD010]KAF9393020.1 hypothetical protein BGX21_010908 [Mortierella sp. AD011]